MKDTVSSHRLTVQRRYRRIMDKNVERDQTLTMGLRVLERPQLAATASDTADEMENQQHKKLPRRTSGSYKVLSVQPHWVTMEEYDLPNTVPVDRLS